jgi:hypothetical protein
MKFGPQILAEVRLLPSEQGGRKGATPARLNYVRED